MSVERIMAEKLAGGVVRVPEIAPVDLSRAYLLRHTLTCPSCEVKDWVFQENEKRGIKVCQACGYSFGILGLPARGDNE